MPHFRDVTPTFAVSPQISPEDVALAKRSGFSLIVNNRPDGEAPDQPAAAEIEAAARSEGLGYAHIPVVGRPTADQVGAMQAVLAANNGKALAYCRSGSRSIMTWALGELGSGVKARDELIRLASGAGYDLSNVLPR
jgi:uncharacterized protein (TIGR01244 family)